MPLVRLAAWFAAGLAFAACGAPPMPAWRVSSPAELCRDPALGPHDFCMPSERIEAWLASGDYRVTHAAVTDSGATRPYKLWLELPNGIVLSVKFKRAPDDFEAFNNSPRRELAAYAIQKLFLEPDAYVVPPTVLTCLPTDAAIVPALEPHPGARCAVGVMAYWVEGVTKEGVLDPPRWAIDPAYRDGLGNLNVLTALIGHQDAKSSNFVRSEDPARPRLFSVDNGISFDAMGHRPSRFFTSAWSDLRVPVLPSKTIERLSALDRTKLEPLGTLAQLRLENEMYRSIPLTPSLDPNAPVRRDGNDVQLGLTAREITDVDVRLAGLLGEVESEEVQGAPARREHN